ncbi:hypothetical protein JAB8_41130 [Janthinobacterium sp. HH106]|uniref:DUF1566 domain-containing protein n=1 Tax=Janthinobacterium sp. HH106 TaxID=1537278 RepID=UPI000893BB33|nr:DUF1566 domain-containing protein [Janthinobacterium sp. HH106]OEZ84734.1 hypothetical protein JAB8_41130 [Janthinobacterium sp. HH106]
MPTAFELWKAELLIVGNIIQDDDTSTPSDEAQRRFQRYCAMLDALTGKEGAHYALAIVQSVQAEHDYGAYQTANRAAWRFGETAYCTALLHELPRLIATLPDWAGDFLVGIANGAGTPNASAITCFNTLLAAAPPAQQALIAAFIATEEDDGWFEHCPGVLGAAAGEHYAGVMPGQDGAAGYQLFLLPGEADALPWQAALDWAAARGACLPTRSELALLHANLGHAFPDAWYWSSEADAILPRMAWSHDFDNGTQYNYRKTYSGRACAVRRVTLAPSADAPIALQPGERYAGLILGWDGAPDYHLVLLPDEYEQENHSWQAASNWAASLGHSLPDRREQTLLYATLKEVFRPNWHWSSEPGDIEDEAWCKDFDTGVAYQNARAFDGYARCVRRVLA